MIIVIDWVSNGNGGYAANVLYDTDTKQRQIWDGKLAKYVVLDEAGNPTDS